MAVKKSSTTGTKKLYSQTPTTGYANAEGGSYNTNLPTKNINQWNNDLLSKYTKKTDSKGNVSYWKGNDRIWAAKDKAGYYHVSSDQTRLNNIIEGYDNKNANGGATYSYNGKQYVAQEQPQADSYYPTPYEAAQIAFDRDAYVNSLFDKYKANADAAYSKGEAAADTTRTEKINDLKTQYNTTRNTYDNTLNEAKANYLSALQDVNTNGFNTIQQNRENAADRGLSNSGLMQAIDQNVINSVNSNRAMLQAQYNSDVNTIKQNVATLVDNYGLDTATANNIYNKAVEALVEQKYQAYKEGISESNARADEYQFETDKFNAGAKNDSMSLFKQLENAWNQSLLDSQTKKEISANELATQERISKAQLENAWKISKLDNETKIKLQKLDDATQITCTKLSIEGQKSVAAISGRYGAAAASAAANLEYKAQQYGIDMGQYTNLAQQFVTEAGGNNYDLGILMGYANDAISSGNYDKFLSDCNTYCKRIAQRNGTTRTTTTSGSSGGSSGGSKPQGHNYSYGKGVK